MNPAGNAAPRAVREPREIEGKIAQASRVHENLTAMLKRSNEMRGRLLGGARPSDQASIGDRGAVQQVATNQVAELASLLDRIENQVGALNEDLIFLERL